MPEYVILLSAIACAAAGMALYFNRENPALLGAVIIGAIGLLYGVGQYVERSKSEPNLTAIGDATDKPVLKEPVKEPVKDAGEKAKPKGNESATRDKPNDKVKEPVVASAPPAPPSSPPPPPQPQAEAQREEKLASTQPNSPGSWSPSVVITNVVSRKSVPKYVDISGTVTNKNLFAIKNVVVRCGDKTYASGDVSATLDQVVPPRSELKISGLRMGPVRPELPPTECQIAKFDRAE